MPLDHNELRAGSRLLASRQSAMFSLTSKDEDVEIQHPKVTFCQGTEVIHTGQQKGYPPALTRKRARGWGKPRSDTKYHRILNLKTMVGGCQGYRLLPFSDRTGCPEDHPRKTSEVNGATELQLQNISGLHTTPLGL